MTPPALPDGALDALLSPDGGTAAFDKVIAEDRAATSAAMNKPILAKNEWNQSKQPPQPAPAKDAPTKDESATKGAAVPDAPWDFESMSDDDVIRLAAVDAGAIPSNLEWDRPALAEYSQFVLEVGIDSKSASSLASYWADQVAATFGRDDVDFDDLEARFHDEWKDKLDERHRIALAAWVRRIHGAGEGNSA